MKWKEIKEMMDSFEKAEDIALEKYNCKHKKIKQEYYDDTKSCKYFKKEFLEAASDRAWDLVRKGAPFNRGGGRIYFDDIWLSDTGIILRWDADHPNDIRDVELTFEELGDLEL